MTRIRKYRTFLILCLSAAFGFFATTQIQWQRSEVVLSQVWAASPSQTPPSSAASAEKPNYISDLEKKIAGQENKPAEEVFKNIQLFKGMPAVRVLRVMQVAFSPALGVECAHCHIPDQWEKDDKEPKRTARKMWGLMQNFNKELKDTIGKGTVNCTTCHRGEVKPALNLPPPK